MSIARGKYMDRPIIVRRLESRVTDSEPRRATTEVARPVSDHQQASLLHHPRMCACSLDVQQLSSSKEQARALLRQAKQVPYDEAAPSALHTQLQLCDERHARGDKCRVQDVDRHQELDVSTTEQNPLDGHDQRMRHDEREKQRHQ
eukprot:scaffold2771_cov252-Pinguiococcus_pyrenoidosus.AAC.34